VMIRASRVLFATAPKDIPWYNGSDQPRTTWSLDNVGKEEANDQEGPGLYFTTDINEARGYGEYVSEVKLNLLKSRTVPLKGRLDTQRVRLLIRKAPDLADTLTNWDEDPRRAFETAVNQLIESSDGVHDLLQSIYADFYRGYPREFFKAIWMYDGVVVPRAKGSLHAIIYNPAIIKTVRMLTRKELDMEAAHA